MSPNERLAEVFDRGLRDGVEALDAEERELFRIQRFIVDYEMGSLSGYFYNLLPDLGEIQETVSAMRKHGLEGLADLLGEAAGLFSGYVDPDPPSTWEEVLRRYDPSDRLEELDEEIGSLDDYGLDEASIA